jgi:hypothetical protein
MVDLSIVTLNNQMVIMESFNHLPNFFEHHDHDSQGFSCHHSGEKRPGPQMEAMHQLVQKMAGKPKIPWFKNPESYPLVI